MMGAPSRIVILAALVVSTGATANAHAQHEGHQMPSAAVPASSNSACALGAQKALEIVEAASQRIEMARTASSPVALRAKVSELQIEVGAAQAHLFTCRAAVSTASATPANPMAGIDHSKMAMGARPAGAPPPSGSKPTVAMAGMDHSKMTMGKPAPNAKPAASGAKPADPMAGMDHSKMNMGKPATGAVTGGSEAMLPVMMAERIADPACPNNVGQATAPKAVYELKVYYFCSTAARDEFRKDPVAYLKKHPR